MSNLTEIDRLIEEGLTLYGCGDLDGALLVWEKALSIEPDNAQATSYVDYVRANYDLLTREVEEQTDPAPFGIDDEPYQVEITTPDLAPMSGPPPVRIDDVDAGWFMDGDDEPRRPQQPPVASINELTIDVDEPPPPQGVEFDDATREYQKETAARLQKASLALSEPASEFGADTTPGFGSGPEITPGFGPSSQTTDVRNRELGFVQPTAAASKPERTKRPSQVPPEIQMTLRSPGEPIALADDIGLAYDEKAATSGGTTSPIDLLESLPLPSLPSPLLGKAGAASTRDTATRDLPLPMRTPAHESKAPPEPTRSPTRDFSAQKTTQLENRPAIPAEGPLINAPTRDLGIRTPATTPRPAAGTPSTRPRPVDEGTRADVILPFDPIDARAAQILDDIDSEATGVEPKEDQTRRRITRLFEKAGEWSRAGELDKAVAAIDLAMSEDPNSALAQKLIQRHRDTTMQVFQAFLGDLQRTPVLARPLHELANAPISPRAAFLLSRVDGTMSIDEILDVSGMPRVEAYRYLCQLLLRGILR